MSTIHFKLPTTATPEQFIAGLTDFGRQRTVEEMVCEHLESYRSARLQNQRGGKGVDMKR